MVGAIEKWKVGIPKMKAGRLLSALGQVQDLETLGNSVQAKVISEEDFENLLEKSTTCVVFVKNVPEELSER